jgi:hypothetical protein
MATNPLKSNIRRLQTKFVKIFEILILKGGATSGGSGINVSRSAATSPISLAAGLLEASTLSGEPG